MRKTRSNEFICGSVVLHRHVLDDIGDVLASVGGRLQQFVYFFLPDERDGILFVTKKIGDKAAFYLVSFVFEPMDLDTEL